MLSWYSKGWSLLFVLCAGFLPAIAGQADTIVDDGAWCWFQDERAVVFDGRVYAGTVSSIGDIGVSQHDLNTRQRSTVLLSPLFQQDDHASPALLMRQDSVLMVFYSEHNGPDFFSHETAVPFTESSWSAPKTFLGGTYPNPHQLNAESGTIHFFCRKNGWQPTHTYSTDLGQTWSQGTKALQGADRPYVKYVSDHSARIHLAYTETHPRNLETSIYHIYYENGMWYSSAGQILGVIDSAAIDVTAGTLVYDGTGPAGRAWVWDIALDESGMPVIVFARFPAETDHRYAYARWDGGQWIVHEIAAGGTYLYSRERNYSGGICLDPDNVDVVYISTDQQVGSVINEGTYREILRGETSDRGTTWHWQAVTSNSTADNIRPIVPENHGSSNMVMWMKGTYEGYTSYRTSIMMDADVTVASKVARRSVPQRSRISGRDAARYTITGRVLPEGRSNGGSQVVIEIMQDGASGFSPGRAVIGTGNRDR